MHEQSVVIAQPAHASRLSLLFHGVGTSAENLVPLGEAIARAYPDAMVISVGAPHPSTLGTGREWFSVVGITEKDRPARIAHAMPLFRQSVVYCSSAAASTQHTPRLLASRKAPSCPWSPRRTRPRPSLGR